MIPHVEDITIRFGDAKEIFFRVRERVWDPAANGGAGGWVAGDYRDLTGWTVLSQIRQTTEDATILLTFTPTLGDQSDLVNGRGAVLLKLTGVQTAGLARTLTSAVYDVQLTDAAGDPWTYIAGAVAFVKDTSRV